MGAATAPEFGSFDTWADVLAHVRAGLTTYYQAPMDYRPVHVACRAGIRKSQTITVFPPAGSGADVFRADSAHLSRFRYRLQAQPAPEV